VRLDNAAIVSGENRIAVTAGWVIGVHRDRRKSKGEVRVGDSARRRKPPSEIADLVGTGRLWVARGEFEILETDAKRHAKGVTMRLVVGDLLMYVVSLTPLELAGKGSMRWAFRALFVPTEQQLARLPVEELTRPSHATIEEPFTPHNSHGLRQLLRMHRLPLWYNLFKNRCCSPRHPCQRYRRQPQQPWE
jgi:hypothetical protein